MIVGLEARVSDGCEVLDVVNEDGLEVLRLEVEVDFEADVEVLRPDDDNDVLLRLNDDDLDAVGVFVVGEVVVVVDGVGEIPEVVGDDCEFAEVVCFELEKLLTVLTVLARARVGLAFADKSAMGVN